MIYKVLEIKNKIEEKRLIFGKKLEEFLLQKLKTFKAFFVRNIKNENFFIYSIFAIILISQFVRSNRDLGFDSIENIKFFSNFGLKNFPKYIQIFLSDFLVNILGIISLFLSKEILKKTNFWNKKNHNILLRNLILLSFTISYFLRPFILNYNEFFTINSLILALFFPYISLSLISEKYFIFSNKLFYGILIILIILLNPISLIFNWEEFPQRIAIIKYDIFPIIFLFFLSISFIRKNHFTKVFFRNFTIISLLILLFGFNSFDNRSLIFSISLPLVFIIFFNLFYEKKFDLKKYFLPILFLFFTFQFQIKNIAEIFIEATQFWWIFTLYFAYLYKNHKNLKLEKVYEFQAQKFKSYKILNIIFLKNSLSIIIFSILFFLCFYGLSIKKFWFLTWILSSILFLILFKNLEFFRLSESFSNRLLKSKNSKFSLFYSILIFAVFSYIFAIFLSGITNQYVNNSYNLKSPNSSNSELIKILNSQYSNKDSKILFFGNDLKKLKQVLFYANFQNYEIIEKTDNKFLLDKLSDKKVTFFIFENNNFSDVNKCQISNLEKLLRDEKNADLFFQNFKFFSNVNNSIRRDLTKGFYKHEDKLEFNEFFTKSEYEIYIRK